jgi:hypothetical protein
MMKLKEGTGTGTAATGTSNPIVVSQTALANPLAPGAGCGRSEVGRNFHEHHSTTTPPRP